MSDDKFKKGQDFELEFDDTDALDASAFDLGIDAANTAALGVDATRAGL